MVVICVSKVAPQKPAEAVKENKEKEKSKHKEKEKEKGKEKENQKRTWNAAFTVFHSCIVGRSKKVSCFEGVSGSETLPGEERQKTKGHQGTRAMGFSFWEFLARCAAKNC